MAETTMCPVCGQKIVKVGTDNAGKPNRVYCEDYKYDPAAGGSVGACDFVMFLKDGKKAKFGRDLTTADIKKLLAGETIVSPEKHKMTFDKEAPGFKKIDWFKRNAEDDKPL